MGYFESRRRRLNKSEMTKKPRLNFLFRIKSLINLHMKIKREYEVFKK